MGLPRVTTVLELFSTLSKVRYDDFTDDEKYIVRSPEEVWRDKLAVCYDMVELERHYFDLWKYKTQTRFYFQGKPNDIDNNPTHTTLFYEQPSNAQAFFLPITTRPRQSTLPVKGKFWHTGIIYEGEIYETFAQGKHSVSKMDAGTLADFQKQRAVIVPVVVNPILLKPQLTSGTSCGSYVARCVGLSDKTDATKTHWPEETHDLLKSGPQWFWLEVSWMRARGIHGPYPALEMADREVLKQLRKTANWTSATGKPYSKFDYSGMNLLEFARYVVLGR